VPLFADARAGNRLIRAFHSAGLDEWEQRVRQQRGDDRSARRSSDSRGRRDATGLRGTEPPFRGDKHGRRVPESDKCKDGAQPSGHGVRRDRKPVDDSAQTSAAAAKIGAVRFETDDRARSILWSQMQDRRLKHPERQLLDAIAAGELDDHLVAIADAVHARRQLLHTVSSAQAISELCVGDRVTFTNRIRPKYLEHELAEVTQVDDRTVTVRLCRPVGRFGDRELRCPPLALLKLDRRTTTGHG